MKIRNRKSKGSAVTEFALGATLMFSLFAGTFQFGYTFYQYNNLYSAVRNAAQYASMLSYDSDDASMSTSYRDAVKRMAVYGSPYAQSGKAPVVAGLAMDNINVQVTFENRVPAYVTVGVQNYSINGLFRTYTFTQKPKLTFRYLGRLAAAD